MRRLVHVKGKVVAFDFDFPLAAVLLLVLHLSRVHSSRRFYPHSDEPAGARCMLVSDTDERALLSKARPRGPSRWSQSPERKMSMNLGQAALLLPLHFCRFGKTRLGKLYRKLYSKN
jgi:hypothetical protein